MRFTILLFLFAVHNAYAQGNDEAVPASFQAYYSLDKLPEKWLHNPKVLKAIDNILPVAIAQLSNSRSCLNCHAGYTLSLKIDTVYIKSQVDHTAAFGDQSGQQYAPTQYETTTSFTYSSKLCIWDSLGREIARLIITEPKGETYRVFEGNFQRGGRVLFAPIVFVGSGRVVVPGQPMKLNKLGGPQLGVVPTEDEVLNFTANKLVTISKWILNRKS